MLKLLGTISTVAVAAAFYEKAKAHPPSELERVAAEELRKVLRYAAPPTFLAPVSSMDDAGPRRRWQERAAN